MWNLVHRGRVWFIIAAAQPWPRLWLIWKSHNAHVSLDKDNFELWSHDIMDYKTLFDFIEVFTSSPHLPVSVSCTQAGQKSITHSSVLKSLWICESANQFLIICTQWGWDRKVEREERKRIGGDSCSAKTDKWLNTHTWKKRWGCFRQVGVNSVRLFDVSSDREAICAPIPTPLPPLLCRHPQRLRNVHIWNVKH